MSITSLSLVLLSILLLSSQASSARRLGIILHNKDPAVEGKRVLLNLSNKKEDETKMVNAKNKSTLVREQQESINSRKESDKESIVQGDDNKEEQATKFGPLKPNKDIAKHNSKMVKAQVNLSEASNPTSTTIVSWHLPREQKKKRKKKKQQRGMSSHDPEFTLDYAPPRVHPPCHNK